MNRSLIAICFAAGLLGALAGRSIPLAWSQVGTHVFVTPATFSAGLTAAAPVSLPTAANGSVATAMSSVGPTGSHTTIQEWFTITDAAGTTRYIPGF